MASQNETFTAKWTESLTNLYVSLLVEEVKKGNRTSTTYNKVGWNNIQTEFNKRTGRRYSKVQLKNKMNKLRRQYGSFKKLLSQSGFGWDSVNKAVVVNDPSLWELHIKDNSDWTKFKKDGFPQFQELIIVFGDNFAIGEYAVGTGNDLTVSKENETDGGDADGNEEDLGEHHIDERSYTPDDTATRTLDKHNLDGTPIAKRSRKSSGFDVANTCKALQEMMKSWTSQSASGSVTSQGLPILVDPFSVSVVIDVLVSMPELEEDLYNKAVERACASATWREAFITSPAERRIGLLKYLK